LLRLYQRKRFGVIMEKSLEDLKYPVGRFVLKQEVPHGERAALIESLATVPARLKHAVEGLSQEQLDTPYREGGWTVRQLVHHVPDSHLNAYLRFKWGLTEEAPRIKIYHEDRWAELPDARTAPISVSLDLLTAIHARLDVLLRSMAAEDFTRTIEHPELGTMDLTTLLRQYEWHGRHHVAHVTRLRERRGW
jgi:hypothetical protein